MPVGGSTTGRLTPRRIARRIGKENDRDSPRERPPIPVAWPTRPAWPPPRAPPCWKQAGQVYGTRGSFILDRMRQGSRCGARIGPGGPSPRPRISKSCRGTCGHQRANPRGQLSPRKWICHNRRGTGKPVSPITESSALPRHAMAPRHIGLVAGSRNEGAVLDDGPAARSSRGMDAALARRDHGTPSGELHNTSRVTTDMPCRPWP